MAGRKGTFGGGIWKPVRKKRPGVHSKTKHSNSKGSKNYVKKYRGQGRQSERRITIIRYIEKH